MQINKILSCVTVALFLLTPILGFSLTVQQNTFLQAEKALQSKDMGQYYRLKAKLKNYSLYPYLQYLEISQDFSDFKVAIIEGYLDKNKGSYWVKQLSAQWLDYLGEKEEWAQYAKLYQRGNSVTQRCWYWQAKYETGHKTLALKGFTNTWLAGGSLPDSCNFMVKKWEGSAYDTGAMRWKRISLAMSVGGASLASYLSQTLPKSDRVFVQLWIKARSNPEAHFGTFVSKEKDNTHFDQVAIAVMKLYSNKSLSSAMQFWQKFAQKKMLSKKTIALIEGDIAIQLSRNYDTRAFSWYARVPRAETSDLLWQWRARMSIRFSNWTYLLTTLQNMPRKLKDDNEWQYWLARAYDATKQPTKAKPIYEKLAKSNSYYSYLSADELDVPYALRDKSKLVTEALFKEVEEVQGIEQVKELDAIGQYQLAYRVWRTELLGFSGMESLAAAQIATKWGYPDMAIYAYGRSGYGNQNLKGYYPVVYKTEVEAIAKKYQVKPAWVWALMRQESHFNLRAESYVGAMGLMQVMPPTAKFIAGRYKIPYKGPVSLYDADTNINIGIANLNFISNLFDGNIALATASYNAGQGNVAKWLPNHVTMRAADWIETVPFEETRTYLRHVLSNMVVYEIIHLKNANFHLSKTLTPVSPKSS
jgi:soluble lytic murein transglycosylase